MLLLIWLSAHTETSYFELWEFGHVGMDWGSAMSEELEFAGYYNLDDTVRVSTWGPQTAYRFIPQMAWEVGAGCLLVPWFTGRYKRAEGLMRGHWFLCTDHKDAWQVLRWFTPPGVGEGQILGMSNPLRNLKPTEYVKQSFQLSESFCPCECLLIIKSCQVSCSQGPKADTHFILFYNLLNKWCVSETRVDGHA